MADQSLGPIDVVVIEFPKDEPGTATAHALGEILDSGVVRLFDIVVLRREDDGTVTTFGAGEVGALDGFAEFKGAQSGLFDEEDIAQAGAILDPGMSALMIAYENSWAEGFVTAAVSEGGRMIATERVTAQALLDALDSAEAEA